MRLENRKNWKLKLLMNQNLKIHLCKREMKFFNLIVEEDGHQRSG